MYEVIGDKPVAFINKQGENKYKQKGSKIVKSEIDDGLFTIGGLERLVKDKRVKKLKETKEEKKAREEAEKKAEIEEVEDTPEKINVLASDNKLQQTESTK